MPYLHLPVQSGSDRILRAMNRQHTADSYLRLVERVRAARPDIALSGDFIVGFPGESEKPTSRRRSRWCATVGYAACFSFKYSRRPGTPAAAMPGQVDGGGEGRAAGAPATPCSTSSRRFNAATVGRTLPVLFERRGRNPGQIDRPQPLSAGRVGARAPQSLIGPDRAGGHRRAGRQQPVRNAWPVPVRSTLGAGRL